MATTLVTRLRGKKDFLRSYVALGFGLLDRLKLLRLAWGRFEVYSNGKPPLEEWSARLKRVGGKSVSLCRGDIQHLAIFDEIFIQGAYDLGKVDFVPDLVMDVGSHIGLFSLLAGTRWPSAALVAIEPHPENAAWSRRNTSANGLRASVIEAAASTESGWLSFNTGGGMGNLSRDGDSIVPVVSLPGLLRSLPSKRLLLKMDIEGEEIHLLPATLPLLPGTCAVFVEIHGTEDQCSGLLGTISSLGFSYELLAEKTSMDGRFHFKDFYLSKAAAV